MWRELLQALQICGMAGLRVHTEEESGSWKEKMMVSWIFLQFVKMAFVPAAAVRLFQQYLADEIDWKEAVVEMPSLPGNADPGMDYMSCVVWGQVCDYCDDLYVWDWFQRLARAVVQGEQFPEFTPSGYARENGLTKTVCAGCFGAVGEDLVYYISADGTYTRRDGTLLAS